MEQFEDRRFLREYSRHPERAFSILMKEFRDRVFIFCRRASSTDMDAEDLAQEVFIRVWKGLTKFRGDSSLTTWIYRIAWNVCASHLGKKGRVPDMMSYTENEEDDDQSVSIRIGTDNQDVYNFENRQLISTLFNSITATHRLVLTLYYLQELSYEEISTITELPMGTVKATLHRAKTSLRKAALSEMKV